MMAMYCDRLLCTGSCVVVKQKTAYEVRISDWSLDVCSADLGQPVASRIANARNDPTFLLADVEIVAEYRLYNINRTKLERLIHRGLGPARLDQIGRASCRARVCPYV